MGKSRALGAIIPIVLALVMGIACGPPPASQKSLSAVLRIECEVPDAEVYLDSQYFREISEMPAGVRLKAGAYRVEVRHAEYHSRYFEFNLAESERKLIQVELAQRLP